MLVGLLARNTSLWGTAAAGSSRAEPGVPAAGRGDCAVPDGGERPRAAWTVLQMLETAGEECKQVVY